MKTTAHPIKTKPLHSSYNGKIKVIGYKSMLKVVKYNKLYKFGIVGIILTCS